MSTISQFFSPAIAILMGGLFFLMGLTTPLNTSWGNKACVLGGGTVLILGLVRIWPHVREAWRIHKVWQVYSGGKRR